MPAPSALHPAVAFARLAETPPDESVTFYNGYFPAISAGRHTLGVSHKIAQSGVPDYAMPDQTVWIEGPQFVFPAGTVQSQFPPPGGSDVYDQELPYMVLDDATLPWERSIIPGTDPPQGESGTPWIALLVLAESEMKLPDGVASVSTMSVADFMASSAGVLRPTLGAVRPDAMALQLAAVRVSAAAFSAVAPSKSELQLLAHVRAVKRTGEDQVLISCILANRLPRAAAAPVRFEAHLVSLEGISDYLPGPGSKPIPVNPDGKPQDVQLVSLANWSFTSLPEPAVSFEGLVKGLIAEQERSGGAYAIAAGTPGTAAGDRLNAGYVPADFATFAGPRSFAWYRGPFSPVIPRKLPPVGAAAADTADATSSDALMIYLAEQGLFDLGYAAAWQAGRAAALGDPAFAAAVWTLRLQARRLAATMAARAAMPGFGGSIETAASTSARRMAVSLLGGTMGQALQAARTSPAPQPGTKSTPAAPRIRLAAPGRALLAEAAAHPALGQSLAAAAPDKVDLVSSWLADLRLLKRIPLVHLVPDARLLPAESVRFFYVDPHWLDALQAGALSLGLHGSADRALHPAIAAQAQAQAPPTPAAGLLLRSQLVTGWPKLAIVATAADKSVIEPLRDEEIAPGVRLVLLPAVPSAVAFSEPYQGLRFGIEDSGVMLRCTAAGTSKRIGEPIKALPNGDSEAAFIANFTRGVAAEGQFDGVIDAAGLAGALAAAMSAPEPLGSGDFAMQMVKAPERQYFPSSAES